MDVITGKEEPAVLEYLLRRRSAKVDDLVAPGPSAQELKQILSAALRVPDHGMMCPWYVLTFEGEARAQIGDVIGQVYADDHPNAPAELKERERGRFLRAPLVVALISRMRTGKKPMWEQLLSAGAAGQNLSLAAHALGYGVQWLTEWYSYDARVRSAMGLDERDHVAGFFYIGTCEKVQDDRARPDLDKLVTPWVPLGSPDGGVRKGDADYDRPSCGFPDQGFDVSSL